MLKLIVLVSTIFLIFSCSQKKEQNKLNIKNIGSLNYIESTSDDSSLLAQYKDLKITFDEVHKKSRVIQEIQQQEQGIYSALMYRMAIKEIDSRLEAKEELDESYNLTIYTSEPKEGFENLVKRLKLNMSDVIKVSFQEPGEEQKNSNIIGVFADQPIMADKLDKNHVAYIELQTKKNDEYLRQVKGIFTRKILFSEAKTNGLSVQDYIAQKVVTTPVTVTDQQVVEFMRSKNVVDEEMTEQLTKSFKNILIENNRNKIIGNYIKDLSLIHI